MSSAPGLPRVRIDQIVLESATFAHPHDWHQRPATHVAPETQVQVRLQVAMSADRKAALVRLMASTNAVASPAYLLDVSVAGLFQMSGGEHAPDFEKGIAATTGGILLPFLRETVANLTSRGRFGPLWIQPMNMREMVERQIQQQGAKGNVPASPSLGSGSTQRRRASIRRKKPT